MIARPLLALAFAGIGSAALAAGSVRVVDYVIDEAKGRQDAAEQGIPLAPMPARGPMHMAVTIAPAVDHDVMRVGIDCSAWKVRNPISAVLTQAMTAYDSKGAPLLGSAPGTSLSGVDAIVTIDRAATLSRCVTVGEMKSRCITRVSIDGSVMRPGTQSQLVHIENEQAANGIDMCAGLTRGIGLVSRQAAVGFVGRVNELATVHTPAT